MSFLNMSISVLGDSDERDRQHPHAARRHQQPHVPPPCDVPKHQRTRRSANEAATLSRDQVYYMRLEDSVYYMRLQDSVYYMRFEDAVYYTGLEDSVHYMRLLVSLLSNHG